MGSSKYHLMGYSPVSLFVGIAVLSLGILIGSNYSVSPTSPQTEVFVEPASFDFGDVRQQETLRHTFIVHNQSDAAIELSMVRSSCSCTTTSDIEGSIIQPKSRIELPVSFKSGRKENGISESVAIFYRQSGTTDPPVDSKVVRLSANVIPDYVIFPTVIDFGRVDHLGTVTKSVQFRRVAEQDTKIVQIQCVDPAFSAKLAEDDAIGNELGIEIQFSGKPVWKTGPLSAVMVVKTNSLKTPTTELLLRANFKAPVEIFPSSIVIPPDVRTESAIKRQIRLTSSRPTHIVTAVCANPDVIITTDSMQKSSLHLITLNIDHKLKKTGLDTEVLIDVIPVEKSDANEARTVKIPVHWFVSQK